MICSDGSGFPYAFLVKLGTAALDYDVRAGDILGVQPKILGAGGLEGQNVVFLVVSAYKHAHAVGKRVFVRCRLVFLFLKAARLLASANIARFHKLRAYGFDFGYIVRVFKVSQHRFEILDFFFVFIELNLLFLDCGLGFTVFFEVKLGVFCRALPDVQRNGKGRAVVVIDDIDGFHARLNQMNVCGQKLTVQPHVLGVFGFEQILGKPLLFQVHFVERGSDGFDQVVRFLATLVRRGFSFEICFHGTAEVVETLNGGTFLKLGKRQRIKVYRVSGIVGINAGFARLSLLNCVEH